MSNFLSIAISILLIVLTLGTAWTLLTLSNNTEISRTDPGNRATITVPAQSK